MPQDNPQRESDASRPNSRPSNSKDEQEIVDELLESGQKTETGVFVAEGVGEIEVTFEPIRDREKRFNYLSKFPPSAAAPEDADLDEVANQMASIPDGEAMTAMEDMVIESARTESITEFDFEDLVRKRMNDEALQNAFELVADISEDANEKQIDGFRRK